MFEHSLVQKYTNRSTRICSNIGGNLRWFFTQHEFRISLQLFPTIENSSESGEGPSVGWKLIHVFNNENSVHRWSVRYQWCRSVQTYGRIFTPYWVEQNLSEVHPPFRLPSQLFALDGQCDKRYGVICLEAGECKEWYFPLLLGWIYWELCFQFRFHSLHHDNWLQTLPIQYAQRSYPSQWTRKETGEIKAEY